MMSMSAIVVVTVGDRPQTNHGDWLMGLLGEITLNLKKKKGLFFQYICIQSESNHVQSADQILDIDFYYYFLCLVRSSSTHTIDKVWQCVTHNVINS